MATINSDDLNYDHPSSLRITRTIPGDLPDDIAHDAFQVEFEKCKRNKIECSRFCHGRNSDPNCCNNNAVGVEFNQRQMINNHEESEHEEEEEEEDDNEMEDFIGVTA